MSSDDKPSVADEEASQKNEERTVEIEIPEERITGLEKDNEKLMYENLQLKDQLHAYEQRFGVLSKIGDASDTTREFKRLGIQERGDNLVKNAHEKEIDVDSLMASNEKLKEENENLTKKLKHFEKLNAAGRKKSIYLLAENKMLRKTVERMNKRSTKEDCKDGSEKAEKEEIPSLKRPSELAGFRNCYYCPVSCVSSVVSFIFFFMGLPVCIRRFEREVQNTLNVLSIECEEEVVVGNCSLAFGDFYNVSIIEKECKISVVITDADKIDHHLKRAIEIMKGELHPALFIMYYKSGTGRAGHCVAIMPDSKFIDVQEEYYWYPEKDPHWRSVSKIELWKVEEQVAKEFEEKCSLKKCGNECIRLPPSHSVTSNELN